MFFSYVYLLLIIILIILTPLYSDLVYKNLCAAGKYGTTDEHSTNKCFFCLLKKQDIFMSQYQVFPL